MNSLMSPTPERNPFMERFRKRIILIVLVIVLVVVGIFYVTRQKEEPLIQNIEVCGFDQEETVEMFKDYKFDNKIVMRDYFFYGETLSIFANNYKLGVNDDFVGKTLVLNNLCDVQEDTDEEKHEIFYLLDEDVDGQLPLGNLEPGLYEVFINYNLEKLRVTTEKEMKDTFNSIKRHNGDYQIDILSSKNLFDDNVNKNLLDDNYFFIHVKEKEKNNSDEIDVLIDPAHGTNMSGFYNDFGVQSENMNQAYELYETAEIIAKHLNAVGIKTEVTKRSKDEVRNIYGPEGRLAQGYEKKAKYYIELDWDPYDRKGMKVWYSNYSSKSLARGISKKLLDTTDLESIQKEGVFKLSLDNGYDAMMTVREAGGKALAAGEYSELANSENGSFAKGNRHAMNAVTIYYVNSQDVNELAKWKKNKENYAKATAEAIIDYIDLGEKDVSTDK